MTARSNTVHGCDSHAAASPAGVPVNVAATLLLTGDGPLRTCSRGDARPHERAPFRASMPGTLAGKLFTARHAKTPRYGANDSPEASKQRQIVVEWVFGGLADGTPSRDPGRVAGDRATPSRRRRMGAAPRQVRRGTPFPPAERAPSGSVRHEFGIVRFVGSQGEHQARATNLGAVLHPAPLGVQVEAPESVGG
jgi:hypothetical protein